MDELNMLLSESESSKNDEPKLLLATVTNLSSEGVLLRFDGADSASSKRYKCLNLGRGSPSSGMRVLVLKMSGTCVVLGSITDPLLYYSTINLDSSASTSDIISAVNRLNLIVEYCKLANHG